MVTPVMARNANAQGQIMKEKFMSQSKWNGNNSITKPVIGGIGGLCIVITSLQLNILKTS
jgi:hypothetical protein